MKETVCHTLLGSRRLVGIAVGRQWLASELASAIVVILAEGTGAPDYSTLKVERRQSL